MREDIKKRFAVLPGYDHERDGIPIPQPMRLYEYTLILADDIVVEHGYLHASNEVVLEERLKNEVGPKFVWDRLTYKEVFCDCGSDYDVTRYFIREIEYIKCGDCREKHVTEYVMDVDRRALEIINKHKK